MTSQYPLDVSVTAQFVDDGNGGSIARASIGPTVYGTDWIVESISTQTTSDSTVFGTSQLLVYQDNETPSRYVLGSFNADGDTASGSDLVVLTLSTLIFVWTKGSIGSYATASLRGKVRDMR